MNLEKGAAPCKHSSKPCTTTARCFGNRSSNCALSATAHFDGSSLAAAGAEPSPVAKSAGKVGRGFAKVSGSFRLVSGCFAPGSPYRPRTCTGFVGGGSPSGRAVNTRGLSLSAEGALKNEGAAMLTRVEKRRPAAMRRNSTVLTNESAIDTREIQTNVAGDEV